MKLPVSQDMVQQFIVQFACRIPTIGSLTAAERKALRDTLSGVDPELFQLFDHEVSENPPNLFQVARQYVVENVTVTIPSLVLSHNSVSLVCPVKLGPRSFEQEFESGHLNQKMVKRLFEVQNVLSSKMKFNRAGKIFEIVLGPLQPSDKRQLLAGIMSYNLEEVSEVNLNFTPQKEIEDELFNFQTRLSFQQINADQPFTMGLRVDMHNRRLKDSLEPSQIQKVWSQADSQISSYLQQLLGRHNG